MKYTPVFLLLILSCCTSPGRLKNLTKHGIPSQRQSAEIDVAGGEKTKLLVQYTGCGGVFFFKDGHGMMIDPFFSHQSVTRIGRSLFGGGRRGKRTLASDRKMVTLGLQSIKDKVGNLPLNISAIVSAHSHYDHLMDVPAMYAELNKEPAIFLNRSGYNTCYQAIDTADMLVLEHHMTTQEVTRPPIELSAGEGKIHIYPILSDHNPHIKNIKFFSGTNTRPAQTFTHAYAKTGVNDWLDGNTFSFLIDYIDQNGSIEWRFFIQSSSCNAPAGVPPQDLLRAKSVDVAFLGVASYRFSPDYPCALLKAINPKAVVWIHWEDFFRKYTKKPKTLRGTDVVKFFDVPCTRSYKSKALLPWPGTWIDIK